MASIMTTVDESLKDDLESFSWVNWSEVGREVFIKKMKRFEALERIEKLLKKSKFTEEDAKALSDKVKSAMHKRLVKEELI